MAGCRFGMVTAIREPLRKMDRRLEGKCDRIIGLLSLFIKEAGVEAGHPLASRRASPLADSPSMLSMMSPGLKTDEEELTTHRPTYLTVNGRTYAPLTSVSRIQPRYPWVSPIRLSSSATSCV